MILLIVGGVHYGFSSPSPSSLDTGKLLTKIGGIIFLVNYIALILLLFLTMLDLGEVPRGERRMFVVSLAALPFLAVRVLYGLMVGFAAGDQVFAFVDGNVYVELGMATIMEICVVVTYAIAGLKIAPMNQKLEEDEYPSKDEQTFQLKEVSSSSSKSSNESKNVMNDSASHSAQKSRGPI